MENVAHPIGDICIIYKFFCKEVSFSIKCLHWSEVQTRKKGLSQTFESGMRTNQTVETGFNAIDRFVQDSFLKSVVMRQYYSCSIFYNNILCIDVKMQIIFFLKLDMY